MTQVVIHLFITIYQPVSSFEYLEVLSCKCDLFTVFKLINQSIDREKIGKAINNENNC